MTQREAKKDSAVRGGEKCAPVSLVGNLGSEGSVFSNPKTDLKSRVPQLEKLRINLLEKNLFSPIHLSGKLSMAFSIRLFVQPLKRDVSL